MLKSVVKVSFFPFIFSFSSPFHPSLSTNLLFLQRADLVNGDAEPTDEESAYQSDDEEEEELEEGAEKPAAPEEAEGTKGVPAFWLNVLKMCPITTDLITERDEEAIEFLRDIRLAYTDDNHVRRRKGKEEVVVVVVVEGKGKGTRSCSRCRCRWTCSSMVEVVKVKVSVVVVVVVDGYCSSSSSSSCECVYHVII